MTNRKNNVIICLIVALVVSICSFAFTTQAFATEETQTPVTNVFEMEEGGYIRYNMTDPGVRFRVRMSEDFKNRAVAENATLGFVISLTEYFTGYENDYLNVTPKLDVESLIVPADKIYLDEDGYYYANAVVGTMLEKNLGLQYSCVAYLTEGENAPIYATYSAEVNSRSWQDIASVAFFTREDFRSQNDYASFGTESLPVLVNATGYNSYANLVSLVKAGNSFENVTFKLTETVYEDELLGSAFKGTLTYADGVGAYYDFTGNEESIDLKMFTVKNSDYKVALNSNTDYVKEGDTSIRLYSTPRWPEWYISQAFVDFLNAKEYDYVTFYYYIDAETAGTTVGSGALSSNSSVLINGFTANSWQVKTYSVSALTSNHCIYLNKGKEVSLSVYIDDVKFFKSGEFTGEEEIVDLAMFSLSGNASIAVNYDSAYVKEGDTSLKLSSPSKWPRYTFTQTFIDWLKANGYTTLSFDYYIDAESSTTYVSKLEGVIPDETAYKAKNEWISFSISVSSLTSSKYIQFNRPATGALSIYLDNVQFS